MKLLSLEEELKSNAYPGRGIVLGRTPDGKKAVAAYFIMGRSSNSRNRIFAVDGEGIRTQAFDESKLEDPSLIIYAPVRVLGNKTIVTNGDQTDTIYEGMDKQMTFEQSLRCREFEPDGPNYYAYENPAAGKGRFIHTYMHDGNPLPSFEGEPKMVDIKGEIDEFTDMLWNSLNEENKVSLFVRYIDIEDGTCETRIVNKNK